VRAQTALAQGVTALTVARANESQARINLALVMGIDPRTPLDVTMDDEPAVSSSDQNSMVALALKQRPDIREAADNVESTRHGVNAARTTNAPVVTGSLGLSSTGTSIPPQNDGFFVGVSVTWNPFDGGFTSGKIKEAKANQAIAAANLRTAQLMVISDVSQAYIAMRDAEDRVLSARNSVTNALEGLRIAEGRFTNGLGVFLDITDAETALESAQSDLTNAQFTVDQSRAALAHAIGAPVPATP
jgi:outer membrane protein TolC